MVQTPKDCECWQAATGPMERYHKIVMKTAACAVWTALTGHLRTLDAHNKWRTAGLCVECALYTLARLGLCIDA
jgi:hypothetical protein